MHMPRYEQKHDDGRTCCTCFHRTFPSKEVAPRPAGPSHSTDICHAPAIPNSAVAMYRPDVPDGVTCIPLDITIPGIGMFALARTAPTSTSEPVAAERNSIVKVLRPCLSAPSGARSTTLRFPDRLV